MKTKENDLWAKYDSQPWLLHWSGSALLNSPFLLNNLFSACSRNNLSSNTGCQAVQSYRKRKISKMMKRNILQINSFIQNVYFNYFYMKFGMFMSPKSFKWSLSLSLFSSTPLPSPLPLGHILIYQHTIFVYFFGRGLNFYII